MCSFPNNCFNSGHDCLKMPYKKELMLIDPILQAKEPELF